MQAASFGGTYVTIVAGYMRSAYMNDPFDDALHVLC